MIQQTFNALDYEIQHELDFEQKQLHAIELSSLHNYTDGITYFYVGYGDLELGRYWRNPWGDGWLVDAYGCYPCSKAEADTDYEAIALIEKSWEEVL